MKTVVTELEDTEEDTDEREKEKDSDDKHDEEAVVISQKQHFKKKNLMIQLEDEDEVKTSDEKEKPQAKEEELVTPDDQTANAVKPNNSQSMNEQHSEPTDAKSNEQSDEKQHEGDADEKKEDEIKGFKVSDQFMKLNFKQQNYMDSTSSDGATKTETTEKTEQTQQDAATKEEDDMFERDEDFCDENAVDDEDVEDEHDNKVKMKVNINVTNYQEAKLTKERRTKVEQQKEFVQDFKMLDLIFSFIGASSVSGSEYEEYMRKKQLNLINDYSQVPSRAFAGTVEHHPGENPDFYRRSIPKGDQKMKNLLPVSCGYFLNIVRQLMSKHRKPTLRYMLLEAKGIIFDKLVDYIDIHSLSDLLVDLMQINFPIYQPKTDNNESLDTTTTSSEQVLRTDLTEDQITMINRLQQKKELVIGKLLKKLSHSNSSNMEEALNSSIVMIELIETERSFELLFQNNCKFLRQIVDLAVDPTNAFNQKYLLNIILHICKNLKPNVGNIFKDPDEDNDDQKRKFDPDSVLGKQVLQLLSIIKETNFLYNLLLIVNKCDNDTIQNQQ